MIIVSDNYDSFTYNLVQYLGELASEFPIALPIEVYRNDKIDLATIEQ
ncbi:MAG: aminodeoxychorismate/anthranilate synthase component II, partial [Microcystis aeruginosa]